MAAVNARLTGFQDASPKCVVQWPQPRIGGNCCAIDEESERRRHVLWYGMETPSLQRLADGDYEKPGRWREPCAVSNRIAAKGHKQDHGLTNRHTSTRPYRETLSRGGTL